MESIVLDNGIEYLILEEKIINGKTYTLFVNPSDEDDLCFRKTVIINNEECYIGLDGEEEYKLVINEFMNEKENE